MAFLAWFFGISWQFFWGSRRRCKEEIVCDGIGVHTSQHGTVECWPVLVRASRGLALPSRLGLAASFGSPISAVQRG